MSGFKETFTKEEGGEKNLDYDDSAFLYFAGVLELLTFCPLLYVFIKKKILGYDGKKKFSGIDMNSVHCPCSLCQTKLQSRKILQTESKFGFSGVLQLLLIIFIAFLLYLTVEAIMNSPTDIKKFDPYEILGIEIGATEKKIKSRDVVNGKHRKVANKNNTNKTDEIQ